MGENKDKIIGSDILRCAAMLFVVTYHIWSLGCMPQIDFPVAQRFIMLGGEIGVTLFFVLSGFGIYFSLSNMQKRNGRISPIEFFKKRCIRILPHYYVHLFLLFTIGTGVGYISREHWKEVLAHLFFVHNFMGYQTINLVIWTIEITLQFYLVAIPLFYFLKKLPRFFLPITIGVTIVIKRYIYIIWMMENQGNGFQLGRATVIFTVLDNFAIGMFVAWVIEKRKGIEPKKGKIISTVLLVILLNFVCKLGQTYGIHTNNWSGYSFHSLLALNIGLILYVFSRIKWKKDSTIVKLICFGAKYEYGIYLYHLVFIENYLLRCGAIMELQNRGWYFVSYVILAVLSIALGSLMNILVDAGVNRLSCRKKSNALL